MAVDKSQLMAKSVAQLKAFAKKAQVRLDDPKTGKAKTKLQLVNSIIMKYRLTGNSNESIDEKRKARSPGKRKSASGKVYYERRMNRADVNKKTMLGGKMTASDIKAKEFKMHLTQLNKVANEIIKARGTKEIPALRKQLSNEMRSCKNCYSAFLSKAK
jgi:hypothetical protein